jgi:hypothetical protein
MVRLSRTDGSSVLPMRVEEGIAELATQAARRRALTARIAVLAFSLGLGSGVLACGSGSAESASDAPVADTPSNDPGPSGSVSLELTAGQANLSAVTYTIVGGQFHTSGTLDVSHSTRISGTIAGIPFGTNYALTLNALSADGSTTCNGSAAFDITSPAPVPVSVLVSCKVQNLVAATPAPIPPAAPLALCLGLLCIGLMQQRRLSATRNRA